jgi:hypothetical protein
MKNLRKLWLGILAIMLVFSGCPETDPDSDPDSKDKKGVPVDKWTVSGKDLMISEGTVAEKLSSFEGKNDVLHIKPSNGNDYPNPPGRVIYYDLSAYNGKEIKIAMSMDVYLKKQAKIAWQLFYDDWPLIGGSWDALSVNTWHSLTNSKTISIPADGVYDPEWGRIVFLSSMQIDGAEAYFANATITITEK